MTSARLKEDAEAAIARQDYVTAARLLRLLAEEGDADSQQKLAVMYGAGRGVPLDKREAVEWHRRAAEQGVDWAQISLGEIYSAGDGVPQDDAQAAAWLLKAAEQGNAFAQYDIGYAYHVGRGVSQDTEGAVRWFRKAAEQGHHGAEANLDHISGTGIGLAPDPVHGNRNAVAKRKRRPKPDSVVAEYLATATFDGSRPPRFAIICGPTATGKTRHRRANYSSDYVLVDAAAIFVSLAPDEVLDFPDALLTELEAAGQALASAAVHARLDIVTEVIGISPAAMIELIDSLLAVGYKADVVHVAKDMYEAWEWNLARSENNISAHYAEEFNIRWLRKAAEAEAYASGSVAQPPA